MMSGSRLVQLPVITFIIACLALAPAAANAAGCDACGGSSPIPDPAKVLDWQGLDPQQFILDLAWTEQATDLPGKVIAGHRFRPLDSHATFDLYTTMDGMPLSPDQLALLGVQPKAPAARAREQAAVVVGIAKSEDTKPAAAPRAVETAARRRLKLPPLDPNKLAHTRERKTAPEAKGGEIIGIVRDLPAPGLVTDTDAAFGEWVSLDDGSRVWAASIHSPGAVAQRLRVAQLDLPPGARIVAYNPADPAEVYGPFEHAPPGGDYVWLPTCFAEVVAIECQVPAGITGVSFAVEQTAHIFKDFIAPGGAPAGWCNLDLTCYPDWAAAGSGVAGYSSINNLYAIYCTGALIADTDPATNIPYFLTANHCIKTQQAAQSTEFYWLWQTTQCNAAPPSITTVPRTSGADYLVGAGGSGFSGGGTDFTLLRLHQQPPPGMTWLGWSTLARPTTEPITVIHHPRGDYKRISFGSTEPYGGEAGELYHKVVYSEGTTEPGSSGSPLLLMSTGQIIGQLWGGYASCDKPLEPDYFGRFDMTFPLAAQWLDPFEDVPTIDFLERAVVVEEGGVAEITLVLSRYPNAAATVNYSVEAASAKPGVDYVPVSGLAVFDGMNASFTFEVHTIDDDKFNWPRAALVVLSDPFGCMIGMTNPATITIMDNDHAQVPSLSVPVFVRSKP